MQIEKSKYKSASEWRKENPNAYNAVSRLGRLKEYYEHFGWKHRPPRSSSSWDETYCLLLEYIEKHNAYPSSDNITYKGVNLSKWIVTQRRSKKVKRDSLTQYRINKLEQLSDWKWEFVLEWDETYNLFVEYCETMNKKPIVKKTCFKGVNIGNWVSNQRKSYKNNQLPKEYVDKLEKINGWVWNAYIGKWESKLEELKEYIKLHNKMPSNNKLSSWASKQRMFYINGKLSDNRIKLLEEINIWNWVEKGGTKKTNKITHNQYIENRKANKKTTYKQWKNFIYSMREQENKADINKLS